jgi:FAD/FMN-containing dehydrogenase
VNRRSLLARAAAIPLLPIAMSPFAAPALGGETLVGAAFRRVRPSDPKWPAQADWDKLNTDVGGRLIKVRPLLADCAGGAASAPCRDVLKELRNPYFVGDQPAGTQTVGWLDAWMTAPSAYAVAAGTTADVVAAVNFARENKLRLVVKGGGHSYQGTSDSADSLLIWTRAMNAIVLHDAFVAQRCAGQAPQPAVTIEAGAMWMHVYDAVTNKAGRYVQGGGCATVGVAGLIQSGGFGSFSRGYGTAASGLLEAEVVTADGKARTVNACTDPELFWGIKGGAGGSLGVVTRVTLRTRELPEFFGSVKMTIAASSAAAFRSLIERYVGFHGDALMNPHWGETVKLGSDNTLDVGMVFQGLTREQAEAAWRPFADWVAGSPSEFTLTVPFAARTVPPNGWWNAEYARKNWLGRGFSDPRPGAPENNMWFAEQNTELGAFFYGFQSIWLPASLLDKDRRSRLADALFSATQHWEVALHFNKGLAGASSGDLAAVKDTAMNPAVLDAFALAIIAGGKPDSYAALLGQPQDLATARRSAAKIAKAGDDLRAVAPDAGSYVSESDYFDRNWQRSFWGSNYPRLRAVKETYDPDGLFFVHHGVGSEAWSPDGFERLG